MTRSTSAQRSTDILNERSDNNQLISKWVKIYFKCIYDNCIWRPVFFSDSGGQVQPQGQDQSQSQGQSQDQSQNQDHGHNQDQVKPQNQDQDQSLNQDQSQHQVQGQVQGQDQDQNQDQNQDQGEILGQNQDQNQPQNQGQGQSQDPTQDQDQNQGPRGLAWLANHLLQHQTDYFLASSFFAFTYFQHRLRRQVKQDQGQGKEHDKSQDQD